MINKADIMLFMHGSLDVPACSKSKKLVELLLNEPYIKHKDRIATLDINKD